MIIYKDLCNRIIYGNKKIITIHGSAGSGKSFFIKKFAEITSGRCLLLAPTGFTALNIEGDTIDSWLYKYSKLPENTLKEIGDKYNFIIVDEISMVQMYKIDILFEINNCLFFRGYNCKLIFVGDPFQISPVVTDNMKNEYGKKIGRLLYEKDFYFFNSFEYYNAFNNNLIDLYLFTQHWRQDNYEFINLLDSIAHGTVDKMSLEKLNQRICSKIDIFPVITTKRNMVKYINKYVIEKIIPPSGLIINSIPEKSFFLKEFIDVEKEVRDLLEPVDFSIGTLVRFIKNDKNLGITNGLKGTIRNYDYISKTVEIYTEDGKIVFCDKVRHDVYRLTYNEFTGNVENQIVAVIKRHPFISSYAVTVHRCQGATLDTMVFNSYNGCFAPGQLYTALSRVKSLQNLYLHVNIDLKDVIVSPEVVAYYAYFKSQCEEVVDNNDPLY